MPIRITPDAGGGTDYASPFLGTINHQDAVAVNLAVLTNAEIDANGMLKPGIPISDTFGLVGVAPAFVHGVTIEALKVAKDNAAATIAALGTIWVAVATICEVNRAQAEAILGRAYTANEIAGFERAGSKCVLVD